MNNLEEEFNEIAGHGTDTEQTDDEFGLSDEELKGDDERSPGTNGLVRLVSVGATLGVVMLLVLFVVNLFNSDPKQPIANNEADEAVTDTEAEDTENPEVDQLRAQVSRLKAERAVAKQSDQFERLEEERKEDETSTVDEDASSPSPPPSSPPSSSPSPPPSPPPSEPVQLAPPQQEEIDPEARWQKLRSVGQQTSVFADSSEVQETVETTDNSENDEENESELPITSPLTEEEETVDEDVPSSGIGMTALFKDHQKTEKKDQPSARSSGERGILTRTTQLKGRSGAQMISSVGEQGILQQSPVPSQRENPSPSPSVELAIGETVKGEVVLPMLWSPSSETPTQGRSLIRLIEPLKSTSGKVVFPIGALVVTEVFSFTPGTNELRASGVAVVYEEKGKTIQRELNKNVLLVRGEDKNPLIAEGIYDPGGDVAKQDTLVGILSALSRVGEVINEPEEEVVINTQSDGGFSTQQTRTQNETSIFAAALEGFFGATSGVVEQRSRTATQEMLNRANIYAVPEGEEVTIVVNEMVIVE